MRDNLFSTHGLKGTKKLIMYYTLFRKQEGKCAICGYKDGEIWIFGNTCRLVIDHSHTTGKIRGLLCNGCNTQVGNYENGKQHIVENMNLPIDDYAAKIEAYLDVK